MNEQVWIFEVNRKDGKLSVLQKFQADFEKENPSLNHAALSFDKTILATGGDDMLIRVYRLSKDFK